MLSFSKFNAYKFEFECIQIFSSIERVFSLSPTSYRFRSFIVAYTLYASAFLYPILGGMIAFGIALHGEIPCFDERHSLKYE